jgi:hypothetical protein
MFYAASQASLRERPTSQPKNLTSSHSRSIRAIFSTIQEARKPSPQKKRKTLPPLLLRPLATQGHIDVRRDLAA